MSSPPPSPPSPTRPAKPAPPNPIRSTRLWITLAIVLLANVLITNVLFAPAQPTTVTLPYDVFKQQVATDNVVSVTTTGDAITGITKTPVKESPTSTVSATHFTTQHPSFANDGLEVLLEQHNVTINAKPENPPPPFWQTLLFSFGPTLLIVIAVLYLIRRAAGAGGAGGLLGAFGQSRARLYDPERPGTTFADVAGIDEVKQELEELVDFLREPQKYERLGGSVPKGVLLIFIDELDAIGRSRSSGFRIGGNDEQEQTLNQILTEMDGFEPGKGVIVLAATNRADVLDQALLRPGRFDRRVTLQPPDRRGRAAILKIHTAKVPLGPDVDLDAIAAATPGLVGADLKNLANEAALGAARKGDTTVSSEDFYQAIDRVLLGTERHLMLTPSDRERIAYHESGHALLGLLVPGADPVRKVTIIPHGGALGVTIQRPVDERFNYGEDYVRARIVGALGGRAAEQLIYGNVTTGAASDLQQVTVIAHEMVVRWGMSPKIGPLAFRDEGSGDGLGLARPYSEAT